MNVYVIADDFWRLINAEEGGLQQCVLSYMSNRVRWEPLRGVLPFGHSMTGSFAYRSAGRPKNFFSIRIGLVVLMFRQDEVLIG